jgi:hypothetical protein
MYFVIDYFKIMNNTNNSQRKLRMDNNTLSPVCDAISKTC